MSNRATVGINYSIKLKFRAAGKYQGVKAGFVDDSHVGIPTISVGIHDGILVLVIDMVGQLEPRTLKNLSPLEVSSPGTWENLCFIDRLDNDLLLSSAEAQELVKT